MNKFNYVKKFQSLSTSIFIIYSMDSLDSESTVSDFYVPDKLFEDDYESTLLFNILIYSISISLLFNN